MVNRILGFALRRDRNFAKPILGALRLPLRESPQFFTARARASRPVLNTSFEHSRHQGATVSLAAFHPFRSPYSDHSTYEVRSASAIP